MNPKRVAKAIELWKQNLSIGNIAKAIGAKYFTFYYYTRRKPELFPARSSYPVTQVKENTAKPVVKLKLHLHSKIEIKKPPKMGLSKETLKKKARDFLLWQAVKKELDKEDKELVEQLGD